MRAATAMRGTVRRTVRVKEAIVLCRRLEKVTVIEFGYHRHVLFWLGSPQGSFFLCTYATKQKNAIANRQHHVSYQYTTAYTA